MTRALGTTGLHFTELGFGAAAIGGLYAAVDRDTAMEAMQAAWDIGMRYFDTAPFYGFGLSERRVGDFLRDKSGYVLSTKVGKLLRPVPLDQVPDHGFVDPLPFTVDFDYSHDAILRSFDMSLARLGLNGAHILYVHDLERRSLGAAYDDHFRRFMDGGLRALDDLKSQKVIAGYGLGVNEVTAVLAVMNRARLDCLLLAGRYTLLDRTAAAEVMPKCLAAGTGVVIGGVFNSGILATGAVPGAHFDYGPASAEIARRVSAMDAVAKGQGGSLAAAALKFALAHPAVVSVLIGSAKATSLRRNAETLAQAPDFDWQAFDPFALV
ncbi:aldo/keto reductase [bacterium]|nr:aldo/keto reductase [bacterium]